MKTIIKSILTLFIIIAIIPNLFATNNDFKALNIYLLNQNPDPVYAGDLVELTLGIENNGYGVMDNAQLEIDDEYPFTLISENTITLNQIFSDNSYVNTQKVKLKVASDVQAGIYQLKLKEISTNSVITHYINISIESNKNIEILSLNKNTISPGGIEPVSFKIKNMGNTQLKNIEFSWDNIDKVILPVNSDNKVFINNLNVNEEKEIKFNISASSAVSADLYKIDLTLSYQNSKTSEVTKETSSIGFYVGGKTDFDLIFNEISGTEYIFTIANIGANDASSVKVSIDKNSKYKTSGKEAEMIGDLNKGDYTTISFDFLRTMGDLNLNIDYTDTAGKRVHELKSIFIPNNDINSTNINGDNLNLAKNKKPSRKNPLSGIQNGVSYLTNGLKYLGYSIILLIILFIGFRVYKKTIGKNTKK